MIRYVEIEPNSRPGESSYHPFWEESRRRPLKVFIDPNLLTGRRDTDEAADIFLTVVEHLSGSGRIECFTVARDDLQCGESIDRLHVRQENDHLISVRETLHGRSISAVGVESDMRNRASIASERSAVNAAKWYDAFIVLGMAETAGVDLLVTKRNSTLLSQEPMVSPNGIILTVAEALAFLGLLFRTNMQWSQFVPPSLTTPGHEWLARRVAVQAVLDREALAHLGVISTPEGDTIWLSRKDSLIKRMTTAVEIRDVIFAQSLMPRTNGGIERISAHLEWLALTISGAFDSLALTVNEHLEGCAQDKRSVSWANGDWRKVVASHYGPLMEVARKKQVVSFVCFCQYLRNTIHDVGPAEFTLNRMSVGVQVSGSSQTPPRILPRKRLYVRMPETVAAKVKEHLTGLGSQAAKALADDIDGTNLDPFVLADLLVDVGLERLDRLLTAIPWTEFGSDETKLPPPATHPQYDAVSQQFVKACYGLGVKSKRPAPPRRRGKRQVGGSPGGNSPVPTTASASGVVGVGVETSATELAPSRPAPDATQTLSD
jgi:hypothetical protein